MDEGREKGIRTSAEEERSGIIDGLRGRGSSAIWHHGDWSTSVFDLGVWYSTVREGDCRFMAAWVKEEKKASGRGREKRNNRRTAWQRIFGCLASRGTGAPPSLTLGSGIAQCVKGTVGLWKHG